MKYLYRTVNALLAAAVFPATLFLEFIFIRIATTLADVGLKESMSLWEIIEILTGKETFVGFDLSLKGGNLAWPKALDPVKAELIAVVVFFALALVCALFVLFWSIFSNKRIPIIISSVLGIASVIAMTACFNSVASLFVTGEMNIVELFSDSWLISLVGEIVVINTLALGGFQNGILIAFILMLVWTGAYYLVEIGEPKEEKVKKANKH